MKFNPFRKPAVEEVVRNHLDYARRALIEHELQRLYNESMVKFYKSQITELEKKL